MKVWHIISAAALAAALMTPIAVLGYEPGMPLAVEEPVQNLQGGVHGMPGVLMANEAQQAQPAEPKVTTMEDLQAVADAPAQQAVVAPTNPVLLPSDSLQGVPHEATPQAEQAVPGAGVDSLMASNLPASSPSPLPSSVEEALKLNAALSAHTIRPLEFMTTREWTGNPFPLSSKTPTAAAAAATTTPVATAEGTAAPADSTATTTPVATAEGTADPADSTATTTPVATAEGTADPAAATATSAAAPARNPSARGAMRSPVPGRLRTQRRGGMNSAGRAAMDTALAATAQAGQDGGVAAQMSSAAFSSNNACQGQGYGPIPDPKNTACWYFCIGYGSLGAYLCCSKGSCYQPATDSCPFGLCGACPSPAVKNPNPQPLPSAGGSNPVVSSLPSPAPEVKQEPVEASPSLPTPVINEPPVQEPEKPPVQEPEKRPVQEPEKPPVQEPEKRPVQEPEKPPVQEPEKPPVVVEPTVPSASNVPQPAAGGSLPPSGASTSCPIAGLDAPAEMCGSSTDILLIIDFMNGKCAWSMGTSKAVQACTGPIFGKTCAGYAGTLFVVFQNDGTGTTPDMQGHLTRLGLGDLTYVENLQISSGPQRAPIEATFLPKLTHVAGNMSLGIPAASIPSQPNTISALPGLKSLQQIGGSFLLGMPPPSPQWGLSFANMDSLSGLKCVGGGFALVNTPSLKTTQGLENLQAVNYAGRFPSGPLMIVSNTGMSSPADLAALKTAAHCSNASPFEVNVQLPAGSCAAPAKLTSSTSLCTSISTGACAP
eukprot:jgi/Botrbrau1/9536/Bobra.0211s0026.1